MNLGFELVGSEMRIEAEAEMSSRASDDPLLSGSDTNLGQVNEPHLSASERGNLYPSAAATGRRRATLAKTVSGGFYFLKNIDKNNTKW